MAGDELFLFVVDNYGLKILGFEDLPAVQTFHIIDAIASGDDDGTGVLTIGLHTRD